MNLVHGVSGASSVGTPLTVTALTSDSRTVTGRLGDAGPMLDARAKREYRQRLRDLKEELKELRKSGDLERGEKVEAEIDFIEREILRAVGFRGRDRRARSAAERARLGVSRAIKRALHRISDHQPLLGKLLDKSIKTGLFSVYDPRRADAVAWRYTLEPAERISEPEPSACIAPTFIKVPADADTAHSAFVGREAESAVLRHHLDRLRRGSGSVVLSDIERLTYR